jgi:putative transposase
MIEPANTRLSVRQQAELLSLNRSGLYYRKKPPSAEETALKHRIDAIYTAHPFYGSRRIAVTLQQSGQAVSRKRVQRCMREMGLAGLAPRKNLSKRHPGHRVYPYLLKKVTARRPNQIWSIDITYIRLKHGWLYLAAIIDWYSRYVVAWTLSQTLSQPFVTEVVEQGFRQAVPEIFNSDQGSQFTSPQYTERLLAAGTKISMDGRGRALDNIFVERLWRSVKYEEVYLKDYQSPREARLGLQRYFRFYNRERPHQSLAYKTPAQVYFGRENDVQFIASRKEIYTLS